MGCAYIRQRGCLAGMDSGIGACGARRRQWLGGRSNQPCPSIYFARFPEPWGNMTKSRELLGLVGCAVCSRMGFECGDLSYGDDNVATAETVAALRLGYSKVASRLAIVEKR